MSSATRWSRPKPWKRRPRRPPASGWLGGPYMWGLFALIVVIVLILIFFR